MAADDVCLNACEQQLLLCVFQGDGRVACPVALVGGIAVLGVVKEIVVEQRPPHHLVHVESGRGGGSQPVAVIGHSHAVEQKLWGGGLTERISREVFPCWGYWAIWVSPEQRESCS